jgi:hypothetical protein
MSILTAILSKLSEQFSRKLFSNYFPHFEKKEACEIIFAVCASPYNGARHRFDKHVPAA